jgi:hypothetical protein
MITNVSKPTYPSQTWASLLTSWATEPKAWGELDYSFFGFTKPITSISNTFTDFGFLWSALNQPWQDATPWSSTQGITNQSKP